MSDDLFEAAKQLKEPLAARMRPQNLDEYIGQDHIVGKGRLLRRAIAADQLTSVIFYGPPGSGKTTLARVIANHTKSNFITLNAVLTGVADIRAAIKQAEEYYTLYTRRTILFVDEVHRWNKAQQDALLPWVENGTIILIGATTENPFFEVNKALVSRSRVFQLKALTKEDLEKAANQAITNVERGYGHWHIEFEKDALNHLVETANGDARSLLNALELAIETTPEKWDPYATPPVPEYGSTIFISKEAAEESIQKKVVLYDRDGDYHYDIISAFIKSLRGRDPDAAMYWLARMVRAGEDPHFIFRRMLISACEDTGLADPYALGVVTSCADAFDRVGLPEGRYHLAHAALYLATSPKSNSSMAFFDALSSVEKQDTDVPNHLRDDSRDAEGFGHGAGYLYPHAYRDHWVAQQYLPNELMGRVFYTPSTQGYESKIRNDVLSRRELQIASWLEDESLLENTATAETGSENTVDKAKTENIKENPIGEWWMNKHFQGRKQDGENLTFSPKDSQKENVLSRADKAWRQRLDSNRSEVLLQLRNTMTELANLLRHDRCLVWNADDALLVWELNRKTPEGVTAGVCKTQKGKDILEQYSRTLTNLDKPLLLFRKESENEKFLLPETFKYALDFFHYKGIIFDKIFFRNPFITSESIESFVNSIYEVVKNNDEKIEEAKDEDEKSTEKEETLPKGWNIIISQKIPSEGQRLSELFVKQVLPSSSIEEYEEVLEKMRVAEDDFFTDSENPIFAWNSKTIAKSFRKCNFTISTKEEIVTEKRKISEKDISNWFDKDTSAYGNAMAKAIGETELEKLARLLLRSSETTIFNWQTKIAYFTIQQ